jgi:hypothetical protein
LVENSISSYFHVNGFLPSLLLTTAFLGLLFYARRTIWGLAVVAFPGTLAHELLHYGVGLILRAQPVGFSLWPKRDGDMWRLGQVSFSRAGIFNSAFIAFAPLLLLPLAWLCLLHVVLPVWISGHWGGWLAAGYLTATLVYGSIPSMTDIRLGLMSLITYLTLFALGWWILSLITH